MTEFLILYLPPTIGMFVLGGFIHLRLLEKPSYRGWWGEYKVNFMLRLCLSGEYTVFSNAIYRGKTKGETTQIDHVVVSRYGIFALETKCLKGKVIVDPLQADTWVQIVGRRKYSLANPLKQNYAHVKALQAVAGVHSQKILSYAVMAGSAIFPDGYPERVFGIWGVVRQIQSLKTPIFSRGHVLSICAALHQRRIRGGYWATRRHVERLKTRNAEKSL